VTRRVPEKARLGRMMHEKIIRMMTLIAATLLFANGQTLGLRAAPEADK